MARDVVIGIDPHKHSWTAVAVDANHRVVGELRVMAASAGYRQLCRLAEQWPSARWAVQGAAGWGRPLVERLTADQLPVIDVPPKLSSRVRQLSTGHGRKTDRADALSVAVAALTGHQRRCQPHDHADMLRVLNERRDDLVGTVPKASIVSMRY
jgi:transposase